MIAGLDLLNVISDGSVIDGARENQRRKCGRTGFSTNLTGRSVPLAPLNDLPESGNKYPEFQGFNVTEAQSGGSLVLGREVL
jgi:hypothetical protein